MQAFIQSDFVAMDVVLTIFIFCKPMWNIWALLSWSLMTKFEFHLGLSWWVFIVLQGVLKWTFK